MTDPVDPAIMRHVVAEARRFADYLEAHGPGPAPRVVATLLDIIGNMHAVTTLRHFADVIERELNEAIEELNQSD